MCIRDRTKAKKIYTEVSYSENDFIMFGKESAGIPEEILLDLSLIHI